MQQTIEREPKTPMEILTEEISKREERRLKMHAKETGDLDALEDQIELLKHVRRRIYHEAG